METTKIASFDRASELKAFDETKTGVKGLVDAGISQIPRIFHDSSIEVANTKPLPPDLLHLKTIPTIDLGGRVFEDAVKRKKAMEGIKEAAAKWGFFQVLNHGVSLDLLEKMKDGVRDFHEQSPEVRKEFYSRDFSRNFFYLSNFDLYSSPAANWRDTFYCYMAPDPPQPQDLPEICRDAVMEYSKQVMILGEFLFELLSEALGLNPNHLKDMDCLKGLRMACNYFPPCPEPDLTFGTTGNPTICNSEGNDANLTRAVICYGMYPGICSVLHNEKSFSLKTMEDGQVLLYSNSVNARETKIPYPWLVFNQKIKVNSVLLRDSTAVSDSTLILFGGSISRGDIDGHLKMLGGYLELFMKPAVAEIYQTLKKELDDLIQNKLLNPKVDMQAHRELLSAIRLLVSEDGCDGKFVSLSVNVMIKEN